MKKYEYKFVEVPRKRGIKVKAGDTLKNVKKIINLESEQGWRLKQVMMPFNEKMGVFIAYSYQIIFEREV